MMGAQKQSEAASPGGETRIKVANAADILSARRHGRVLAGRLGFTGSEATLIAAAISEVARNIVQHAACGELLIHAIRSGRKQGIMIVAKDEGPGIPDIEQAMQYGYSTTNDPGLGLAAARWLMDELTLDSKVGSGTIVTMKKWLNKAHEQAQR